MNKGFRSLHARKHHSDSARVMTRFAEACLRDFEDEEPMDR